MFGRHCLKALGLICLVLPFTGCTSTNVDAVVVTPTVTDFQGVGGHVQLTAIATINHGSHPATYEDVTDEVTWSTPLTAVAHVSSSGYVTIVGLGLTQITATINGYQGVVSGNTTVCAEVPGSTTTITCPSVSASDRPASKLSLVQTSRSAARLGETRQFTAVRTSTAGDQEDLTDSVKWTSSDESVATVSKSGMVTGIGQGSATIMASVTNADRTVVASATNYTVK
jgi:trimeric autotransporter adhesin